MKNYANFELGGFSEEAKRKYREEHWEEDLQRPSKPENGWRKQLQRSDEKTVKGNF